MMLARVCRMGISPTIVNSMKTPVTPNPISTKIQPLRLFASGGRTAFTRSVRKSKPVMERLSEKATETPFTIGKIALAGASTFGLGALCYYGLGLDSRSGVIDNMHYWPEYVKERIRSTYMYFGGSVMLTAASVALFSRSSRIKKMLAKQGLLQRLGLCGLVCCCGFVVLKLPYKEGFGAKQLAWMVYNGAAGFCLTSICFVGGPLIIRAALYTAGVIGGLSTIAICAPSERFLTLAGPLAIGLGFIFASTVASMFLPPTTVLGTSLLSLNVYGGIILFSLFLLHHTQKLIKQAEEYPVYFDKSLEQYDPINNALHIYADTISIFVRILATLYGSPKNK